MDRPALRAREAYIEEEAALRAIFRQSSAERFRRRLAESGAEFGERIRLARMPRLPQFAWLGQTLRRIRTVGLGLIGIRIGMSPRTPHQR